MITDIIKQIRIQNDLTQEQFAKKIGIDQAVICRIERGLKPSFKVRKAIAVHFNRPDLVPELNCQLSILNCTPATVAGK
jgi:transcriptional regulator with XRE-family HTH domain